MTVTGGGDGEECSWDGGVLVRLQVRAGWLCRWEQETCGRIGAGTSGGREWVPFLRRNAVLGAALARHPVS